MVNQTSSMERVGKKRPCPVCGKPDWCLVARDGGAAICQRVQDGAVKLVGEAGWLHILQHGQQPWRQGPVKLHISTTQNPAKDFVAITRTCQGMLTADGLASLSASLGVSAMSLERLGIGWNGAGYTFPMRDGARRIIGLHIRYPSGFKAAERGSSNGLFIPDDLAADATCLICEGCSDTAAALDLGFAAVGRPSCSTGTAMAKVLLSGRSVVIVGDNDPPKRKGQMPPGQRGAEALAEALALHCPSVRVVYPPTGTKDLRQWKAAGLTREAMLAAIAAAEPVRLTLKVATQLRRRGECYGQ